MNSRFTWVIDKINDKIEIKHLAGAHLQKEHGRASAVVREAKKVGRIHGIPDAPESDVYDIRQDAVSILFPAGKLIPNALIAYNLKTGNLLATVTDPGVVTHANVVAAGYPCNSDDWVRLFTSDSLEPIGSNVIRANVTTAGVADMDDEDQVQAIDNIYRAFDALRAAGLPKDLPVSVRKLHSQRFYGTLAEKALTNLAKSFKTIADAQSWLGQQNITLIISDSGIDARGGGYSHTGVIWGREGDPDIRAALVPVAEIPTDEELKSGKVHLFGAKTTPNKQAFQNLTAVQTNESAADIRTRLVKAILDVDILEKHLWGKHNQKTHGRFGFSSKYFPDRASAQKTADKLGGKVTEIRAGKFALLSQMEVRKRKFIAAHKQELQNSGKIEFLGYTSGDKQAAMRFGKEHNGPERDDDTYYTLSNYVQNTHYHINTSLRQGAKWDGADVSSLVHDLDDLIKSRPLKKPVTVWRGIGEDFFNTLRDGKVFKDKGFVSTTLVKQVIQPEEYDDYHRAFDYVLKIKVPKGVKGFYVGTVGSGEHPNEFEFLLQRGLKFRVKKIDRENKSAELEVVA